MAATAQDERSRRPLLKCNAKPDTGLFKDTAAIDPHDPPLLDAGKLALLAGQGRRPGKIQLHHVAGLNRRGHGNRDENSYLADVGAPAIKEPVRLGHPNADRPAKIGPRTLALLGKRVHSPSLLSTLHHCSVTTGVIDNAKVGGLEYLVKVVTFAVFFHLLTCFSRAHCFYRPLAVLVPRGQKTLDLWEPHSGTTDLRQTFLIGVHWHNADSRKSGDEFLLRRSV